MKQMKDTGDTTIVGLKKEWLCGKRNKMEMMGKRKAFVSSFSRQKYAKVLAVPGTTIISDPSVCFYTALCSLPSRSAVMLFESVSLLKLLVELDSPGRSTYCRAVGRKVLDDD